MSDPRMRVHWARVFGTGRTIRGQMWFAPTHPKYRQNYEYLLAYCAERHGIQLNSYCQLSNHEHWTCEDPEAAVNAFKQHFRSLLTRTVNAERGESGNVFENRAGGDVDMGAGLTPIEKAAYTIANPVAAGLVYTHSQWPGAVSTPLQALERPRVIKRPKMRFYGEDTTMPEEVELKLYVPREHRSDPDAWCAKLAERVIAHEHAARADMKVKGLAFLGPGACRQVPYESYPATKRAVRAQGFRPTVAADTKDERTAMLGRMARFEADYKDARSRLLAGHPDVVFPYGTARLPKQWAHVRVADPPADPRDRRGLRRGPGRPPLSAKEQARRVLAMLTTHEVPAASQPEPVFAREPDTSETRAALVTVRESTAVAEHHVPAATEPSASGPLPRPSATAPRALRSSAPPRPSAKPTDET